MGLKEIIFGKQIKTEKIPQYGGSTEKWLPIVDIQNGIILTKDGRYIKILEVLPVNFALKSTIERQNIIYYYGSYLKIAPDNLQIKVITQKADIEGYVARMWSLYEKEPVESCKEMIEDNIREVSYLAANIAVTRRFFLIFQHEMRMKTRGDSIQAIAERLSEEEQTARRYLGMCGLEVLSPNYYDSFHLELLYSVINKRTSTNVKLPRDIFTAFSSIAGEQEEFLKEVQEGEK